MLRFAKWVIVLGALLFFLGIIAGGFLLIVSGGNPGSYIRTIFMQIELSSRQADLERSAGADTSEQLFIIASGDTPSSIGQKLFTQQLIVDSDLFVTYMIVEDLDTKVQEGAFFLRQSMTIPEIAAQITNRENAGITFTTFAGTRMEEIAAMLDSTPRIAFSGADFLAVTGPGAQIDSQIAAQLAIPAGASLEGFLYPDVYILSLATTAADLRDMMLQRFISFISPDYINTAAQAGLTLRDIVILASIIEREAIWDDEMPLISSVYRNRLDIGMKLDADPTVQYGLQGTRDSWWPQITQTDYQAVISPYNTYLNYGLPPGAISNPGIAAIRAAIYPADSNYLYFRARCDGSGYHIFSLTYEEHINNGC